MKALSVSLFSYGVILPGERRSFLNHAHRQAGLVHSEASYRAFVRVSMYAGVNYVSASFTKFVMLFKYSGDSYILVQYLVAIKPHITNLLLRKENSMSVINNTALRLPLHIYICQFEQNSLIFNTQNNIKNFHRGYLPFGSRSSSYSRDQNSRH